MSVRKIGLHSMGLLPSCQFIHFRWNCKGKNGMMRGIVLHDLHFLLTNGTGIMNSRHHDAINHFRSNTSLHIYNNNNNNNHQPTDTSSCAKNYNKCNSRTYSVSETSPNTVFLKIRTRDHSKSTTSYHG